MPPTLSPEKKRKDGARSFIVAPAVMLDRTRWNRVGLLRMTTWGMVDSYPKGGRTGFSENVKRALQDFTASLLARKEHDRGLVFPFA
jgi:hypothetical protein